MCLKERDTIEYEHYITIKSLNMKAHSITQDYVEVKEKIFQIDISGYGNPLPGEPTGGSSYWSNVRGGIDLATNKVNDSEFLKNFLNQDVGEKELFDYLNGYYKSVEVTDVTESHRGLVIVSN